MNLKVGDIVIVADRPELGYQKVTEEWHQDIFVLSNNYMRLNKHLIFICKETKLTNLLFDIK